MLPFVFFVPTRREGSKVLVGGCVRHVRGCPCCESLVILRGDSCTGSLLQRVLEVTYSLLVRLVSHDDDWSDLPC